MLGYSEPKAPRTTRNNNAKAYGRKSKYGTNLRKVPSCWIWDLCRFFGQHCKGKEYWVRFYSFFDFPITNKVFHTFLHYKPVTSLSFLKIRSCSSMAITTN